MEQSVPTDLSIKNFISSSNQIIEGESVSFFWEVQNADKVFLDEVEVASKGDKSLQIIHNKRMKLEAKKKGWFQGSSTKYIDIELAQPEFTLDVPETIYYLKEDSTLSIACTFFNVSKFEFILIKKDTIYEPIKTLFSKSNILKEKVWKQEVSLDLQKEADIVIKVFNGNQVKTSDVILVRIKKPKIIDFSVDKTLIVSNTEIFISWEIKNARKIEIDNEIGDVTGLHYYSFMATARQTFQITLKVTGCFSEITEQTITVYVAKFDYFFASNNGDYRDPLFYLNWNSEYFDNVILYPNNVTVPSRFNLYNIPFSNQDIEYRLAGMVNGNIYEVNLLIQPAKIHSFYLVEQGAILNTEAHLKWETENYQSISLEPLINNNPGVEGTSFYVTNQIKTITLIIWGKANVVLREIEIKRLKAPQIIAITVPQPSFHYTLSLLNVPVSLVPFIYEFSNSRTKVLAKQNLFQQPLKNVLHLITSLSTLMLMAKKMVKRKLNLQTLKLFFNIKNGIDNYNKT